MIDADAIAFAHRLADTAGAVIRPFFRRRLNVIDKGRAGFDPVTAADREAETAMRALIRSEYPDDGLLGEEHGEEPGRNQRRWVLDPIDGTRAFITGRHSWGTLIALEENLAPVLGVLDQPVLRERFVGYPGCAQLVTSEGVIPLATRACPNLADAIVSTTHPWSYFTAAERNSFEAVCAKARMSSFGGDCYAYGLLAMGYVDLIIEASLAPWDVAALIPIVENAGGFFTDWNGNAAGGGGRIVAAGDARLHAAALDLLNHE
jgi:myo-inositol-1(or 4)-monophosphatase